MSCGYVERRTHNESRDLMSRFCSFVEIWRQGLDLGLQTKLSRSPDFVAI